MCNICGQPDYLRCNCQSTQPYCDQCAEDTRCGSIMDAACIIYHFDTQQPSQLTCLGIQNGASLEDILEAIDDLICNSFNIPFEPEDTESISWIAGGPAGHKPKANVIISPDDGNGIVIRENGLYAVGDGKVKVDADDEPDYLENQIEGGSSASGVITNTIIKEDGILKVIPSLDIAVLMQVIQQEFSEEFCQIIDSCKCFLQIENLVATFSPACPEGFVLNEEGTLCVGSNSQPATITLPVITACPQFRDEYSAYGGLVYDGGYNSSGEGASGHVINGILTDIGSGDVLQLLTANVWQSDNSTGNNNGPANRAGIWVCPYTSPNTLGFVVPVNVPSTKTYYIAVAADNDFRIDVDGVVIVDSSTVDTTYWGDSGAKFRFWHIYPVNLTAGIRYIGISGIDTGIQGMLAAEIYDNTLVELQAAALEPAFISDPTTFPYNQNHYLNLNLLFTTRCARSSGTFSIGSATCPPGYNLDTTGGGPLVSPCQGINSDTSQWICVQTITSPFSGYTATLVWDRIPNAVEYQVQHKLSSDPDSAYVDASTSPVVNPGSGSTVNTVIPDLPSDEMDFRVRAVFEDCETEWTVVSGEIPACVAVSFASPTLPDGEVGTPYNVTIPLSGTAPFNLSGVTKPDWMAIQVIGTDVVISGTPDDSLTDIDVIFTVENCDGDYTQTLNQLITIVPSGECVPVTFTQSAELPDAESDSAYSHSITLNGTAPFSVTGITKPDWMTIAVVGSTLQFTGTPDSGDIDEGVAVNFTVENCTSDSQAFTGQITVLNGSMLANPFRFGTSPSETCSATPVGLYWLGPNPALTPGNIMYTDDTLSTPLTGYTHISDSLGFLVYTMNSATGAIIASTGTGCD